MIDWGPILRDVGGMAPKSTVGATSTPTDPSVPPNTKQDLRDAADRLATAAATGSAHSELVEFALAQRAEMDRQLAFDAARTATTPVSVATPATTPTK